MRFLTHWPIPIRDEPDGGYAVVCANLALWIVAGGLVLWFNFRKR